MYQQSNPFMRRLSFIFSLAVLGVLALTTSCDREPITFTVPVAFDSLQFRIRPAQVGLPGHPRQFVTGFREVDTAAMFNALRKMDNRALLKHIKQVALTKLAFSIPAGAGGDLSVFDSLQLVCKKPGAQATTLAKVPVTAASGSGTTEVDADLASAGTEEAAVNSLAGVHSLSLEGSTKEGTALESETTLSTSLDVDVIIELDPND